MTEIIFMVEQSPEGGYKAKALGYSIFTDGETIEELKQNVRETVRCHFEADIPKMIRFHFVKEEVFYNRAAGDCRPAFQWPEI